MLWQIDIYPKPGEPNRTGADVAAQAADMGLADGVECIAAHGFLVEGELSREQIERLAKDLLVDSVVEVAEIDGTRDASKSQPPNHIQNESNLLLVHVLPKPGVMDPVAQSAETAICDLLSDGHGPQANISVRTFRKYWIANVAQEQLSSLASRLLANDAIEQVVLGPLPFDHLEVGSSYTFRQISVPIRDLDDAALTKLSREGQLYLSLVEMQTIQSHFREFGRDRVRYRTGNDRSNLERALQPQDARRTHRLSRRKRRAAIREYAEGNDLCRDTATCASWGDE